MQKKKMQKSYRLVLAACAVTATLLSGCTIGHTHQASGEWEMDLNNHWQACTECGKKAEKGAHTIDESEICTVCGAVLMDFGDYKSLRQFNEHDDLLKSTDYDANGNIMAETIYNCEYDAEGNLLRISEVTDGVLSNETGYITVNGERVANTYIDYAEDGSKSIAYFDENENIVQSFLYNADGSLEMQTDSEYVLSENGVWYEAVTTAVAADGTKDVMKYSEDGEQTEYSHYEASGDLALYQFGHDSHLDFYFYAYDADGYCQEMQYTCNDVLRSVTFYATVTTEDGPVTYAKTVTDYEDDGTKTMTDYNKDGEVVGKTRYDAEGVEIP